MRGSLLEQAGDVIRKHWILILVIALAVAASGWLYAAKRRPFYEADVKLRIIRSSAGRSSDEFSFSFEEDHVFYNTQYTLLRTQLDWAEQALDRAAWLILSRLGIDYRESPESAGRVAADRLGPSLDEDEVALLGSPAEERDFPFSLDRAPDAPLRAALDAVRRECIGRLWGFGPDGLLGAVRAEPIANTYLARLTCRAADAGVAVFLVNLYSELYRDVSREERKEALAEKVAELDRERQESDRAFEEAEKVLRDFRREHPDLWPGERLNRPRQEAAAIAARVDALDTEAVLRKAAEAHLAEVLESAGLSVVTGPSGRHRLARTAETSPEDRARLLAANFRLLSLPVMSSNSDVTRCRDRLQSIEQERLRLPADLTEENPAVRAVRDRMRTAELELGVAMETAIVDTFDESARNRATTEELRRRFEEREAEARRIDELYTRLEALSGEVDTLGRQKESLDRGYSALSRIFEQSGSARGARLTIQNIRIERRARLVDAQQILPNKLLLFVLTACAAVLLSLGAAWLREFFDDTIKSKADFERFVAMPDIGYIPRIQGKDASGKDLAMLEQPSSAVAEAFRTVRTGILFSRRDEEIRTFLLTSAGPSEGKTTVALNLAITMAEADRGRVLLIDSDLRRPRVHRALGIEDGPGLTNCLVGSADLSAAVRETRVRNLFVLPAGPVPPNPAELLGGRRMAEILKQVRQDFAKVILDTPPVLPVTDASVLATQVDGVFLVISLGRTSWRLVRRAEETLKGVGVSVTGAILNNVRSSTGAYGYGYEYSSK
ncbi:MAG: polysaccharide biosynthesis tyrosine autokinase [Planctomycetes bacterium]|nr:polysaccharide biosynthesis tyrosine autokinase [Planctomycetota bacterium]